ncbi:helix-turn-helix transcriptional regulator [Streptomyces gobiensis]|uniref:helix-turn-helix transcriptional regulator n=1 Tax=Streptomyces gobiensis TaxID=2875706 RepID=UPI001E2AED58|nr:LuxR family transcriptional regulator [Streptomyces gobiensis]UGY92420.1 LuxR C-terminal-related transcriptional regulator [Streptomyces gobiensis]
MSEVLGRERELGEIRALVAAAYEGRSGALVLVGEPGVGKTAVLTRSVATADCRAISTQGGLAAGDLPFAGLHRLLIPFTDALTAIPRPQADALEVALGIRAGPPPDRFLISLAVLSVFSELAEERPLLVVVDDAHWLDRPSADALSFAASRFDAEGVVLLAASRPQPSPALPGLPELELRGLDREACRQLITAECRHFVARVVEARIVAETAGNPLALTEILAALSEEQLAGRSALPCLLPIGPKLERAYEERVAALAPAVQELLLLAAIQPTGDLGSLEQAARGGGLGLGGLDAAAAAGLIEVTHTAVRFRHPLIRSAVYRGAPPSCRRRAHLLLARTGAAEHRVWHLAAAAYAPDERLATDLERTAARAQVRSGYAAAARALERAAELSEHDADRARRNVAAAWNSWLAGLPGQALALMDRAWPMAEQQGMSRVLGAIDFQRGSIWLRSGVTLHAYVALMSAVDRLTGEDPTLALTALMRAAESATYAGDRARFAVACRRLAGLRGVEGAYADLIRSYLHGVERAAAGSMKEALASLRAVLNLATGADDPPTLIWAATVALMAGDDTCAHALAARALGHARAKGAVATAPQALELVVYSELWTGRFPLAGANAAEGLRLATETGQVNSACHLRALLALHAALAGNVATSRDEAAKALEQARAHHLGLSAAVASWALAVGDLVEGRFAKAAVRLRTMARAGPGHSHGWFTVLSIPHYVEAAVLSGERVRAERALTVFADWTDSVECAWAEALIHRCRALMATGDDVDTHFHTAMDLHRRSQRDVERARTALLYGSHLRRHRRRAEARPFLREAWEVFQRLGMEYWSERARHELRTAGETVADSDTPTLGVLTPQQLQIARHVARGETNREVAAQLFVSPRTVDYHLRNIFTKLGITSRAALIKRFQD